MASEMTMANFAVETGSTLERPSDSERTLVQSLMDQHGVVAVGQVARVFGMSAAQVAASLGLPSEAVHKSARMASPKTQRRLRDMLEIVGRISDWAGGRNQAMAWYRSQPIPAFGDQTAEALVKAGKADAVRDYLDGLALGGFA
jgi:hypothetical protein